MSLDFIATSKKAGMNVLPGRLNKYALNHLSFKGLKMPESSYFVKLSPVARKELGLVKAVKYYEISKLMPFIQSYQSNIKVNSLEMIKNDPDHRIVSIAAYFGISGVFLDMTVRAFKYHLTAYPKIALGIATGALFYEFASRFAFRLQMNNANRFYDWAVAHSQNVKTAEQA